MNVRQRIVSSFAPPAYLTMPAAGVDIGAGSVKSMLFAQHFGECTVRSYNKNELAEGIIVDGEIEKHAELVAVLRAVRLRERIHFAHASVPEKKAYLYQILVPEEGKADLRAAVEFSLESHVPIPAKDAHFDFEIVREVPEGTVLSVTVYAKRLVESYQKAFADAGIGLLSLEMESQAMGRAVVHDDDRDHVMMAIDFGRQTTRFTVYDHGVAGYAATVEVGGDSLTSAAMKHFGVTAEEAEVIKNEKGFLHGEDNRELYEAMMTTVSVLKDEIYQNVSYWNNSSDEGVPRTPIERMVLVGGNANLKGLPEYLSRALDLPVRTASVWDNAFSLDRYIPEIPRNHSLEYATTIGLALRSCNPRWW